MGRSALKLVGELQADGSVVNISYLPADRRPSPLADGAAYVEIHSWDMSELSDGPRKMRRVSFSFDSDTNTLIVRDKE